MKVLIIFISIIVSAIVNDSSIIGKQFPVFECENYNWDKINLPDLHSKKYTVIGIAFSNAAETQLETWIQPVYDVFKTHSSDNAFDMSIDYDVHLYFVPSFSKANQVASKKVKEKIKSKTDAELYPYLLFLNTQKEQRDVIAFDGLKVAYFIVFDPEGKIVYATSGEYEERKVDEIIDIVSE